MNYSNRIASIVLLGAIAAVSACSSGSGAGTELNPQAGGQQSSQYAGPPPATDDVQSFRINLWENINSQDRCAACHSQDGGQSPMFARTDDVNLAYTSANTVVDLTSPEDSLMVARVESGHNCWLTSDQACADILATWITNWAGELAATGGREIQLEAPFLRDPGVSRHLPADSSLFETTVYPILMDNCANCHASSSAVQQSPFFAEGPASDAAAVDSAYEAAKSKINLDDPAFSRFVVRLRDESHNCWTNSCANDADDMQDAIEDFAQNVDETVVDPSLITSKALTLYEGTIAAGGNRHETSQIALYEFKSGFGTTAFDTSGVEPAMDLTMSGDVSWFGGWGLNFAGGKAQASTASSAKLYTMLGATGEYSIEAWVVPANVVQEEAHIIGYSGSTTSRNFTVGQTMYNYDFFARTTNSDANGSPQVSTPDAAEVLQASLQHVVVTFHPVDGRRIYLNGLLVSQQDSAPGGALTDWDNSFAFVLGNETSNNRPWAGVIRLAAVHNRVLTQPQILQNFEAGVGEKFFLLFSVEEQTNIADAYIVFEGSQYDSYSYLFREPFFISLDETASPNGVGISGIRIGLNGAEASVGQSFANVNATITSTDYSAASGQPLANIGAVVPLENGPEFDEFFLTFDELGGTSYARPAPAIPAPATPQDLPAVSALGVRTFEEINKTLAELTGVSALDTNVVGTYANVRESMPAVPTAEAFLASHQVAIAQLAIEYCNALIEDTTLRGSQFPGFPFTSAVATAFPGPGATEDLLIEPLLDRVLGTTVAPIGSQPARAGVKSELEELIHGIPSDGTRPGLATSGGDGSRTRTIAKSVCAAAYGSGLMLIQ